MFTISSIRSIVFHHPPDDGHNNHLKNVAKLPDYTAKHPRKQSPHIRRRENLKHRKLFCLTWLMKCLNTWNYSNTSNFVLLDWKLASCTISKQDTPRNFDANMTFICTLSLLHPIHVIFLCDPIQHCHPIYTSLSQVLFLFPTCPYVLQLHNSIYLYTFHFIHFERKNT